MFGYNYSKQDTPKYFVVTDWPLNRCVSQLHPLTHLPLREGKQSNIKPWRNPNTKSKFTVAYPSFTNFYVNLRNSVNNRSGEESLLLV